MANPNKAKAESGIMRWVDDRFPATQMMQDHLTKYYAPKNFNFFYIFGVFGAAGAGQPNPDRRLVDHEFQSLCRRRVCLRRVHHA